MSLKSSDILNKIDSNSLEWIYEKNYHGVAKKKDMVSKLSKDVDETGIKILVNQLKKEELVAAFEGLNFEHAEENNENNSRVLNKRLYEMLADDGVYNWLNQNASDDLLDIFCVKMGLMCEENKKAKIKAIAYAVTETSLENFFARFEPKFLREICVSMRLKHRGSSNKAALVHAIVTQKHVPERKVQAEEDITFSKNKKPLRYGITYQDIFQHYNVDEISEWIVDHDISPRGGNKKEKINIILAYLEENKGKKMASPKKASPKKAAAKKAAPKPVKKTQKKKEATPEPESDEEVEEVEEEEMEEVESEEVSVEEEEEEEGEEEEEEEEGVKIEDCVFCLSGTFSMKRSLLEKKITKMGAHIASDITKSVTHLMTEEDPETSKNSKVIKAKKAGVEIVNEDFLETFE